MKKVDVLRKKYPKFIYEKYFYRFSKKNLVISFNFKIEPDIVFRPRIIIKNVDRLGVDKIREKALDNLIFHLGLMEVPSYWKTTCSPEIVIKAGSLTSEQIKWWKDLIKQGMGQFFYENKINFRKPNFLRIISNKNATSITLAVLKNRILLPIGGGKDSVVTLETLKEAKKNINCFSLNPTKAAQRILEIAGCKKPIIIRRKVDGRLLKLNRQGFLNGHTPFSAYLAFLSVLIAVIFAHKYIAFSNERSSNEGNVKYLGKTINHQYSKSFDFEKRFRSYSRRFLAKNIEYFSFLRPLYEIQIAKLFSKYSKYFPVFLSCNEAYKTVSGTKKPRKKWCGKCPKCLFVFAILYPFVAEQKLIKIFGKNLFEDRKLLPILEELIGVGFPRRFKPFECVGIKKESLIAFYLSLKKTYGEQPLIKLPILLKYFEEKILPKCPNLKKESLVIMDSWNHQNNLPKEFAKILKNNLTRF